jgi:hypothetical protein
MRHNTPHQARIELFVFRRRSGPMETPCHRGVPHLCQHIMIGKRLEGATAGGEQPFA